MSSIIRKYSASVIVVASIVLGFFFPEVGLVWKPYLTLLLMLLMFLVALGIESNEIVHSMRNYQVIVIGLLTVFVLTPALSVLASLFFSPMIYVGTVLAFCCPPAIVTTFWTEVFGGDVAVALVITAVTSLLSIVTIPGTMLLAVGTTVSVDIVGLMTNLGEVILIPMTASFLLRRFVKVDWLRVRDYAPRVQLGILVLLIWGSVAAGVGYVSNSTEEFALLNVFMFCALGVAFTLTHFLAKRFEYRKAISIEIAAILKNAALSLVIGIAAFGPSILPPLIANLIAQNLLLIPVKALTKEYSIT
jgi:BASS family bile acid:Na+ symporter